MLHTISGGRFGVSGAVVVVVVLLLLVVVVVVLVVVVVVTFVVVVVVGSSLVATSTPPAAAMPATAAAAGSNPPAAPTNPGPLPNTPAGPVLLNGAASSLSLSHSLLSSTTRARKSSVRLSDALLLRHSK